MHGNKLFFPSGTDYAQIQTKIEYHWRLLSIHGKNYIINYKYSYDEWPNQIRHSAANFMK